MSFTNALAAVLLVLGARRRIALRRLRERAFELFVLGPLILGAVAWVGERYLDLSRPVALEWLSSSPAATALPSLILGLALAPVLWPSALRELFGHAPLDALPVPEPARLIVTLFAGVGQALWPTAALAGVLWVLAQRPPEISELALLLAGMTLLAWIDTLLAAVLVHIGRAQAGFLLGLGAVGALCAAVPALRWLLLPWGVAGSALHAALDTVPRGATASAGPMMNLALAAAALLTALSAAHLLWRRGDLERGRHREGQERRGWLAAVRLPASFAGLLEKRWPGPLRALLRRDVLLVARRFSPAVHLSTGLAAIFLALAALALDPRLPLQPAWRLQAIVGSVTLAVLAGAALVPFLLHRQLPVFWLEKATGVPLEQVWAAKFYLALILALPGFLYGMLLILIFGPGPLAGRWLAVGQLLLTSIVVSTLIGLASFEIATEPLIGTLWSGLVALALASLFVIYPKGWWMWLIGYGWAASEVAKRASRRVRMTEVAT